MDPTFQVVWFLAALIFLALAAAGPFWPSWPSKFNSLAIGLFCFVVVFFWTAVKST